MELPLEAVALFSLKLAYETEDQSPILRDDLIMSTVDYERGACNASGLFAYINSQIQFDLTCNPLPIGERHVPFDHVFDRRSAHSRNKRRRKSGEQE